MYEFTKNMYGFTNYYSTDVATVYDAIGPIRFNLNSQHSSRCLNESVQVRFGDVLVNKRGYRALHYLSNKSRILMLFYVCANLTRLQIKYDALEMLR